MYTSLENHIQIVAQQKNDLAAQISRWNFIKKASKPSLPGIRGPVRTIPTGKNHQDSNPKPLGKAA